VKETHCYCFDTPKICHLTKKHKYFTGYDRNTLIYTPFHLIQNSRLLVTWKIEIGRGWLVSAALIPKDNNVSFCIGLVVEFCEYVEQWFWWWVTYITTTHAKVPTRVPTWASVVDLLCISVARWWWGALRNRFWLRIQGRGEHLSGIRGLLQKKSRRWRNCILHREEISWPFHTLEFLSIRCFRYFTHILGRQTSKIRERDHRCFELYKDPRYFAVHQQRGS